MTFCYVNVQFCKHYDKWHPVQAEGTVCVFLL
mgnify:CR=1 FL=1